MKHKQQEVRTSRGLHPPARGLQGRAHLTDITIGLSGNVYLFRRAGTFADLSDLPNYKVIPEEVRQKDGVAVATRVRYWCMTYNKNKVKESELPDTWDDLLTIRACARQHRHGQPAQQLPDLWGAKGEDWSQDFLDKLFGVVKPQLRKEGMSAILNLVILGEGDMAVPSP